MCVRYEGAATTKQNNWQVTNCTNWHGLASVIFSSAVTPDAWRGFAFDLVGKKAEKDLLRETLSLRSPYSRFGLRFRPACSLTVSLSFSSRECCLRVELPRELSVALRCTEKESRFLILTPLARPLRPIARQLTSDAS